MHLNPYSRTLALEILYCGPALSGKGSVLKTLYKAISPSRRGPMTRIDGPFSFDTFPRDLGEPDSVNLRVRNVRLPGQLGASRANDALIRRADAVVFVADVSPDAQERNKAALAELQARFEALGCEDTPVVFQWNKSDLVEAVSIEELELKLNPAGCDSFATFPNDRMGVVGANTAAICSALAGSGVRDDLQERSAAK